MSFSISRRDFLAGLGLTAAAAAASSIPSFAFSGAMRSPFKIAVINDEIGQDFGHVCEVASKEFGMQWIELRGMWDKNIVNLDAKEVAEARRILQKNNLRVTDIASPLFKTDWPGAPKSKYSPKAAPGKSHDQFNADFTFEQQDEVFERSLAMAKAFGTNRVRCFDFWRIEDQSPFRAAIDQKLLETAKKAGDKGVILMLENEPACNTATGAESARLLEAVKTPHFMLNWDPGNASTHDEVPYPDGYKLIPKDRIGHCHCKDSVKAANGEWKWECMGKGVIDWVGQFRALMNDGYRHAVSLETHWHGAGTPEESSRQSWAGMKAQLEKVGALK
ncbi:MAG TPA: sugar phosphate isomerase/epimerase family protein [Terriglobales bacterium]|nr:sugar phosphate isomerase/epimerase family protein [Terriglobales bacterium]